MKKKDGLKKLTLSRETIRSLEEKNLAEALGATGDTVESCKVTRCRPTCFVC
jgi:hypothetical protein